MKIMERLNNYLYEKEYQIILKDNLLNIVNYDEIIDFLPSKIIVRIQSKIITISGKDLKINKMYENELLITGTIISIGIN